MFTQPQSFYPQSCTPIPYHLSILKFFHKIFCIKYKVNFRQFSKIYILKNKSPHSTCIANHMLQITIHISIIVYIMLNHISITKIQFTFSKNYNVKYIIKYGYYTSLMNYTIGMSNHMHLYTFPTTFLSWIVTIS